MLIAFGENEIWLAFDPGKRVIQELPMNRFGEAAVIIGVNERILPCDRKADRAWFVVLLILIEQLVQADHLEDVSAVHDVLVTNRIPPVPGLVEIFLELWCLDNFAPQGPYFGKGHFVDELVRRRPI